MRPTRLVSSALALGLLVFGLASGAVCAEVPTYTITIKDHKFNPDVIEIPAGQKVKLIVHNQDSIPEEFESAELNREKIIGAGAKGIIYVGPLEPGDYPFMGEFHQDTAKGRITVK